MLVSVQRQCTGVTRVPVHSCFCSFVMHVCVLLLYNQGNRVVIAIFVMLSVQGVFFPNYCRAPMSYCSISTFTRAGCTQAELVERQISSPIRTHVISCERCSFRVSHGLQLWGTETTICLVCRDHSSLGHSIFVLQFYFVILQHCFMIIVLCVFYDFIILLLYMCLFGIKSSGLVTPPGEAAFPQFPTSLSLDD